MKSREKLLGRRGSFRMWPLELLMGILILSGVFLFVTNKDMQKTEEYLASTVGYIKEQCNQYGRMTLASETKSLLRISGSARQIEQQLTWRLRVGDPFALSEASLAGCVRDSYSTGAVVLNKEKEIEVQYGVGEKEAALLQPYLDSEVLRDTANHPEKTYSVRFSDTDGAYIDLAAVGIPTTGGIVVAYYHTPLEYIESFSLTTASLLSGYSVEHDGTIVVSSGNEIVASNDEKLVGKSTDEIPILRKIKEVAHSDRLVHERKDENSMEQSFGLMEHGRDYYIYAYMSESNVFGSTFQNLFYALVIYLAVVGTIHTVRWKTAQGYREDQLRIQKEYTENLQVKNEQLKEAVQQADRANVAKTNFLSRMSHDIRTPLNGIIGLLKIDEAHPEDIGLIRANQKKMMVAAQHLLSLINDILQMSKLESGEIQLAHEPLNLQKLCEDVLTIVEQRAAEAGITLNYDRLVRRVAFQNVYGSPLHIRHIFLNIYGNCIKYNKVGGNVRTSCTCLGNADGIVTYQWTIEDTGIGMSEEFLEHIFDPFAQERTDARSVYHGSGLGMAIVKSLVDKMNGTIEVKSKVDVGSTFVITLPFELADVTALPLDLSPEETMLKEIRGLHLLLAEDNELNAEIAQTLLADEGVTITLAHDGKEAIDAFTSNPPGTFDGILMDVMMPVIDGLSATRTIRAMDRADAKTIPIIAMTANAFDEDIRRCLNAGMNAHLAKPLQMERVVEVLARKCGRN